MYATAVVVGSGVDVLVTGTVLGLCVAIFVDAFGLMFIMGPFVALPPR